jgi:hypothetical protein
MEHPPLQSTPVGAFRFNTDSSKLEYYDGNQWVNITSDSPQVQTGGTRGLMMGGNQPAPVSDYINTIEYANFDTTGNFTDFGDRTVSSGNGMFGLASRTRGVAGCGYDTSPNTSTNIIDFVEISSTGNATDFGDAAYKVEGARGVSDATRGVFAFGFQRTDWATKNDLQYFTIATTGNAVDTGIDITTSHRSGAAFSSPTRGIFAGGNPGPSNVISYITISSLSQAADFGDLLTGGDNSESSCGCSNAVRGLYFGGLNNPATYVNNIEYITIATLGNASDFGDSTNGVNSAQAAASPTRGVHMGGGNASPYVAINTVDYVQIMTTGNAVDFGDLTVPHYSGTACSNGHGGLG